MGAFRTEVVPKETVKVKQGASTNCQPPPYKQQASAFGLTWWGCGARI
jgi:hypothetical protein